MIAGYDVMHEEFRSEKFSKESGMFEMVQLWMNLSKAYKMTEPKYQAIKSADIPTVNLANEVGIVSVIAGELDNITGVAEAFSPINMWDVTMNSGKQHQFTVPESHNLLILVLDGTILINEDEVAHRGELVTFEQGGKDVQIESNNEAKLLILTNGRTIK